MTSKSEVGHNPQTEGLSDEGDQHQEIPQSIQGNDQKFDYDFQMGTEDQGSPFLVA